MTIIMFGNVQTAVIKTVFPQTIFSTLKMSFLEKGDETIMTNEEKNLLERLAAGVFDGRVGDSIETSGGSTVWKAIKNGLPVMFKQGPGGKFFNGKENEHYEGALHTIRKWKSDEEKLEFFQRFGWLMRDSDAKEYSAKFKPKR